MTFYAEDSDVLSGGEWVRVGLVWRWVAEPDAEPEPDLPDPPSYLPADLIACPTCGARMDERCKTLNGDGPADHRRRLVKRVCSCGGPVRPQEPMCGFCRAEMAREEAA
jgi:hypothetical protein